MKFDCKKCLHEKVCELWSQQESQNASCFCLDGCDYFSPATAPQNKYLDPCDVCIYNPPSSMGGKPCFMCPASGRPTEGKKDD